MNDQEFRDLADQALSDLHRRLSTASDQHISLCQVPNNLFGEERIARGTLGDKVGKAGHRPVVAEQFSAELRYLRVVQRFKRYGL